jgi:hypothetical protein
VLKAGNGEIIGRSEMYSSKAACETALTLSNETDRPPTSVMKRKSLILSDLNIVEGQPRADLRHLRLPSAK